MIDKFNQLSQKVSKELKVTSRDLYSNTSKRTRDIADARHILFWLCKQEGMTISYIQKFCKLKGLKISHSAIIHGVNKVGNDDSYKAMINV
jgi:chromosomal replication initiation ATPase DnaA